MIDVKPGSPAEERGIRSGDVILEVAGKEVHDPADVKAALEDARAGRQASVLMLVRSGDDQRFVALPVGQGLTNSVSCATLGRSTASPARV